MPDLRHRLRGGHRLTRRAGCELVGRDGLTLTEKWSEGIRTLHGMHTRGFPNCFIMASAQSGFTVNFPHMLDEQAKHLAYIVGHATQHDIEVIEASQDAEDAWVGTIIELARRGRSFLESCTPGYYNNEGRPGERAAQNGFYGAGPVAFVNLLAQWRADGALAGLELDRTDHARR